MPKLPPQVITSRIPARKLCRSQRRARFAGLVCVRRRMSDAFVLWLHRGHLKRAVRIVRGQFATQALGNRRPMGESDPARVRDIMLKAGMHLDMLVRGTVPASDVETHDYLCHIVGISQIRVMDIGLANRESGGVSTANELLLILNAAAQGLLRARERHGKTGRWGLDGPAIEALRGSLDIYEEVLSASSAMQMERAQGVRLRSLQRQQARREWVAA